MTIHDNTLRFFLTRSQIAKILKIMRKVSEPREPRDYIHVLLPIPTKDLLRRLRYDLRVSITDILIRVLDRADREGVLEEWIKAGGPMPVPPPMPVRPPRQPATTPSPGQEVIAP